MKHNNEIPVEIRQENSDYNAQWITSAGMVGDSTVPTDKLDVEDSRKHDASPFMVVWLRNIDRLCSRLPEGFDFKRYTLLDVGCGSGISTIYFFKKGIFKSLRGFDFSASLVDTANQNKAHLLSQGDRVDSLTFEVEDANEYRVSEDPLVIFMFNPFGWETMSVFIKNNIEVLRKTKSVLLYANDICIENIENYGKVLSRDDFYNLSVVEFGT